MHDIVIKAYDKAGNAISWPTWLYEKDALCQLRDFLFLVIKKLTFNPLQKFCLELEAILTKAQDDAIITSKQHECLRTENPTAAYKIPQMRV